MEHLALEVFDLPLSDGTSSTGSQYAYLPEDASITITDVSEIFASGDVWSHSFTLNVDANAHIFGSSGDVHGGRLHDQINKRRARLWVEGLALFLGYLKLDDEAEVDGNGNVDITFESGQKTFDELIEGAKANQVPMADDVQIGMALWQKRKTSFRLKLSASAVLEGGRTVKAHLVGDWTGEDITFSADAEDDNTSVQSYPRMIFPKGEFSDADSGTLTPINCINTDTPYAENEDGTPTNPFCNVPLCYQRYGYEKKLENGSYQPDYSSEPEAQRGYEYMPANRVNSAPNFFVLYWLRCLMNHLGIYIEENQMMDVEDLRRLFFVNTNCACREPKTLRKASGEGYRRYRFRNGRPIAEYYGPPVRRTGDPFLIRTYDYFPRINTDESKFFCTDFSASRDGVIQSITLGIDSVEPWSAADVAQYENDNSYLYEAYATSECFPDADVSEVIKAIESGFGVRFLFSDDYKRVRIVLLRNIFRSAATQHVVCEIVDDDVKVENPVRGFRMTYGDNKDDTHFFYKGFDDLLPKMAELWKDETDKHDYSHWDVNAVYDAIIRRVNAFDKTCYVTPATGNAYGIKIDKDAKRYMDLHPSVFEYAGFMDAVDGDCTGEEETVETITVPFAPAIMNDLNMDEERGGEQVQRFALFVDETMRPRRPDLNDGTDYNAPDAVYSTDTLYDEEKFPLGQTMKDGGVIKPGEFLITSDMYASKSGVQASFLTNIALPPLLVDMNIDGYINEGYRLYLQDNYEPDENGMSPIEAHQWGLTLGVMRGSGSDAYVKYEPDLIEAESPLNDWWETMPGSNTTVHPDICDSYGHEWDYDGSQTITPAEAPSKLSELFPNSDAPFYDASLGYITHTACIYVRDNRMVLLATEYSVAGVTVTNSGDIRYFVGLTLEELQQVSSAGRHVIVEVDSSAERGSTLVQLCKLAYGGGTEPMRIDNGVGSRYGRFSLKLRAEKPNPDYDPTQAESSFNRRYLPITNENLRGRGLCDQFYKDYSFWVRNARIVRRTVRMELAQLLIIDKTKRVTVGDVTGFVRKMQYSVSNKTGLGNVTMEIMYI